MHWIKDRALKGERLLGIGAMLGSSMIVELIGKTGFDWAWIDYEHGLGDTHDMLTMMQAAAIHKLPAIVRLPANDLRHHKQALDFGAAGVMVPYVNTAEEAAYAAKCTKFSPKGLRGIAQSTRAAQFGLNFVEYMAEADDNVLTIVQIETPEAVGNVDEIAAVEGVDVLFVGPLDLSVSMGLPRQFDHPDFVAALDKVLAACKAHNKVPGILTPTHELAEDWTAKGFKFLVVAGDGSLFARTLADLRARWEQVG